MSINLGNGASEILVLNTLKSFHEISFELGNSNLDIA